jgi:ComF family protein
MKYAVLKEFLLDLLFPTSCLGCKKPEALLCDACRGTLPSSELTCIGCGLRNRTGTVCTACRKERRLTALDRALWATLYDHTLAHDAITHFKYFGASRFAAPLGALMIASFRKALQEHPAWQRIPFTLLPIPLNSRKRRERGYNQSELLAREIAAHTPYPLLSTRALERVRYTPSQTMQASKEARRENIQGAFRVADAQAVQGKAILLIDDIATTGSTLNEAARALKEAGAEAVWALVAARG